jgi:hypothetical protein
MGRIALEVAVQAPLPLGDCQFIVGFAKWSMPM